MRELSFLFWVLSKHYLCFLNLLHKVEYHIPKSILEKLNKYKIFHYYSFFKPSIWLIQIILNNHIGSKVFTSRLSILFRFWSHCAKVIRFCTFIYFLFFLVHKFVCKIHYVVVIMIKNTKACWITHILCISVQLMICLTKTKLFLFVSLWYLA